MTTAASIIQDPNAIINENVTILDETPATYDDDRAAFVRHLLPLASTAGLLLNVVLGQYAVFAVIAYLLIIAGFVCALTICPGDLLRLPFTCAGKGFRLVRNIVCIDFLGDLVAGLFGLIFGFFLGVAIMFCFPAVFSIARWVTRYDD